jgi:hypothetical protein
MISLRQILKARNPDKIKSLLTESNYYISPLGLIMSRSTDEYCLGEVSERGGRWEPKVILSKHVPDSVPGYQFETEREVLESVLKSRDIPYKLIK